MRYLNSMISILVSRPGISNNQNLKTDSIRYVFNTNVLNMNMNERIRPSTIASSEHNDIAVR